MTDEQLLKQFANQVYLTKFNRFIDGVDTAASPPTDTDALIEIQKVIMWANLWADELELETDYEGRPMDWRFLRENDVDFGAIASTSNTGVNAIPIPTGYRRLVYRANRPLTIMQDVSRISTWKVVDPNQQTRREDTWTGPRVTSLNGKLVFSRAFNTTEVGGHIFADLIKPITRMFYNPGGAIDVTMLKTIPHQQLMVLGVAKNATLPGIVEGGLTPALTSKYASLMEGAKAASANTSIADDAWDEEDFGYIGMI